MFTSTSMTSSDDVTPKVLWPSATTPRVLWPDDVAPKVLWPSASTPRVLWPDDVTPKVLWQTWKSYELPEKMQPYREKWIALHPVSSGWSHLLLDDEDLRKLVEDNFPQHLPHYDSFTHNIERVDFARYVMMYLGGVYADIDTYPLKPIDVWVNKNQIVLGCEPKEHAEGLYGRDLVLCNALLISPPKLEFWVDFMEFIIANYEPNGNPVHTTGPMAMTLFYDQHPENFTNVLITDPCVFFPLKANNVVSDECSAFDESYVVHVWENSWVPVWWKNPRLVNPENWFWGLLVIFFVVWSVSYRRSTRS